MQDGSSSSSLLSCGRRNVNKRASIPACTLIRHFLFLLAERFGSLFCARSLSLSFSLWGTDTGTDRAADKAARKSRHAKRRGTRRGRRGGGSPDFLTSFYRSSRCMGVDVWVYGILLYVQYHVIYTQLRCGHVNIHLQNPYRLNTGKAIYPHQMVLNIYSGGGSCSPVSSFIMYMSCRVSRSSRVSRVSQVSQVSWVGCTCTCSCTCTCTYICRCCRTCKCALRHN